MRQPPLLQIDNRDGGDPEAQQQAEYSRQEARNVVQDHLHHHTETNPGRSSDYVTWIATLHPENADVTIDQRFFVPGNPWWTIYEDTKNNMPTATAIAINEDEDIEQQEQPRPPMKDGRSRQGPSLCLVCSPVDTAFGLFVLAFAIMGTLLSEGFGLFLCYVPAFICYHIGNVFGEPNVLTGIWYSFFMVCYYACALCDSVCLLISVVYTEILAIVAYLVGLVTGGVLMARFWHQYNRRVCHGIRIALRNKHYISNPTRDFMFFCDGKSNEFERQADGRHAPVESAIVQQVSPPPTAPSSTHQPGAVPVSAIVTHELPPQHVVVKE